MNIKLNMDQLNSKKKMKRILITKTKKIKKNKKKTFKIKGIIK